MKQIAFISGKGGTGKTSISSAIFSELDNSILVDCDVEAPNSNLLFDFSPETLIKININIKSARETEDCVLCGKCAEVCRFNAIEFDKKNSLGKLKSTLYNPNKSFLHGNSQLNCKVDGLSENCSRHHAGRLHIIGYLCRGCEYCTFICPKDAIYMVYDNHETEINMNKTIYGKIFYADNDAAIPGSAKLITLLRQQAEKFALLNNINYVLIDGPPGLGCSLVSTTTAVDCVCIITESTSAGYHDLLRLYKMLNKLNNKIVLCLNKYDLNLNVKNKIEKFCFEKSIDIVGRIPFNKKVNSYINQKCLINDSNLFYKEIKELKINLINFVK